MNNLAKYLTPPLTKGNRFDSDSWDVHGKNDLIMRFALQLSTDSPHPCRTSRRIIKRTIFPYWIDLLYTIKVKENGKRAATQIKRLATSRAA